MSGHRPLAAIVYLTQNTPLRRRYLQTSLYFLFRSFNERCHYPVLIFHEGDFTSEAIEEIRAATPRGLGSLIQFREVRPADFVPPAWATSSVVDANRTIVPDSGGLGYRSMCRWWIRSLPRYVEPYDYYMRLDDDSIIEETLAFDPFCQAIDHGVDYASNLVHMEHPLNALGLRSLSLELLGGTDRLRSLFISCKPDRVVEHSKFASFLRHLPDELCRHIDPEELWSPIVYYSNFHIARSDLWDRPAIRDFLTAVDETGGIYRLRWGDAPLQTIAVAAGGDLALGRFGFRYSKRYEREQGTYVNTNHPSACDFFDSGSPLQGQTSTGSMSDFRSFNQLLNERQLNDLVRLVA